MLHHLAVATIQVASLVNYNCHPQEDGNGKGYSGVEKNKKTMVGIEYAKW